MCTCFLGTHLIIYQLLYHMKNIIKINLWILISMVLFLSCSDEHDVLSNSYNTIITASSDGHSSPYTRTQVGGVAEDGSLIIQWSANDKIGVFGKSINNVQFVSTNSTPADKTNFSGSLASASIPEKAYYPYSEKVNDITTIPMTIPGIQVYKDVTSLSAYDFKAADKCNVAGNGIYHMHLRQMATVLRMQIELDGVNKLNSAEKVQSVEVAVDGCALSGNYTYNLNNLDEPLKNISAATDSKSVTVELANKPLVSDKVIAYAVIAPGAKKDAVIRINITTDKHKATFSTNLLGDIRAGVFYDLPLTATVINTKSDLKVENVVEPTPDPTPTEETANCYMINTTGEHDFCATQIGNGDKGIIPNAGFHVTSSKISPKSAKLMWQDVENFIDASSIRLVNGRVHYTANKNSGNAMSAVDSGENCTGEILGSWHIWGVGDEMPVAEEVTNRSGAKFMVMNRTLGSHSELSQYATLYQWGRKDPFPNSSVYYMSDGSRVDISSSYPIYQPQSSAEATILGSVRNCDKLMNAILVNGAYDWLSENNDYLWGDLHTTTWLTTNPKSGAGWTDVKTIYDPSPVGYRVANKNTFTGFSKHDNGAVDINGALDRKSLEEWSNFITEPFMQGKVERSRPKHVNGQFIGFFFKKNDTDNVGSFYPMTGYRFPNNSSDISKAGGINDFGISARYYSSGPHNQAHSVFYFYIGNWRWLDKKEYDNYAGNNVVYKTQDFVDKWIAHAIRCVKE